MDADTQPLQALAANADADPVPGSIEAVGPDLPQGIPLVTLGYDEEFMAWVWEQIDKGSAAVKQQAETWDVLLKEYLPLVKARGTSEDVDTNLHFRNVHTKMGQLYLQDPEIRVIDEPVSATFEQRMSPNGQVLQLADILAVKQEILNKRIGPNGLNALELMDEVLFDLLAWAGIACIKVGHRMMTNPVEEPVMGPDPNFIPDPMNPMPPPEVPQVDPMTGEPMMQTIQVPIYEDDYAERFSPKKLIIDPSLKSTRYDNDSGMIGMWFSLFPSQAKAALGLTEEDLSQGSEDERVFKHPTAAAGSAPATMQFAEIFFKANFANHPAVNQSGMLHHPWKLYQMVVAEHIKDRPLVWRECVDQTFTPDGRLTENSIDRFPIRVAVLRPLADSPFPPADAAFVNGDVKALNYTLQQDVALRDAAIGKYVYNTGAFEDGGIDKLKRAKVGEYVGVDEEYLNKGMENILTRTPQVTGTNDGYRLQGALHSYMDQALGLNANSAGSTNDVVRAATEIAATQQGSQGRSQKEQSRVIGFFLDMVRLLDIYICRYTTQTEWVRLVGPEGAQRIFAWNGQMLSGRWLYSIQPDSQLRADTAQDRQQLLMFYNLLAKDPLVDRSYILKRLARTFNFDPSRMVLNPMQQMMQPQHGGEVNKHANEQSGGQPSAPGAGNQSEATRQQQE